jgi:hypothetical protein
MRRVDPALPSRRGAGATVRDRVDEARACCLERPLLSEIDELERSARPGIPAARAVEWLEALSATWHAADVREEKAELLHAIYERIVVAGDRIVSARLTPEAQAHGMALVLPQVVMARPTGVKRADAINIRIPIEGAGEAWWAGESA